MMATVRGIVKRKRVTNSIASTVSASGDGNIILNLVVVEEEEGVWEGMLGVVDEVKEEEVEEADEAVRYEAAAAFEAEPGVVIKARNPNNNNEANNLDTLFLISSILLGTVITEWWLLTIKGLISFSKLEEQHNSGRLCLWGGELVIKLLLLKIKLSNL